MMTFLISGIPGHILPSNFGEGGVEDLPGLQLVFSGNRVIRDAERVLRYGEGMVKGLSYYNLTYVLQDQVEIPEVVIKY